MIPQMAARRPDAIRGPANSATKPQNVAPSEMNPGKSWMRLETRPRMASGADICSIVIWLVVKTTSEAPPHNSHRQ